jgi:hypothetical protein
MTDRKFAKRLLGITRDCRDDMHEPDNQGVFGSVTGRKLDNADGDNRASREFVVRLELRTPEGTGFGDFNLATLIAFARIGARSIDA